MLIIEKDMDYKILLLIKMKFNIKLYNYINEFYNG